MDRIKELISSPKLSLVLCVVGLTLVIGGGVSAGLIKKSQPPAPAKNFPKESKVTEASLPQIKVDVSGAVSTPGVYTIRRDSRVEDVIKAAGGFAASADPEYISKALNLSQKVSDGQKVYIPFKGETPTPTLPLVQGEDKGGGQFGLVPPGAGLVGINSGTPAELESLPSIGPVTAKKIITSRPYSSTEDLVERKVVSRSVFEKIKELIDTK